MKNVFTLLQGMVMGIAEILPGVSGSTFALIMGIYDDFINLLHGISTFIKTTLQFLFLRSTSNEVKKAFLAINFKFGIILVLGMLLSIALLSNVIGYLLDEFPQYVAAFFFGLVLISVTIPWKEMNSRKPIHFIIIGLVTILTFVLLGLKPAEELTSPSYLLLFVGGIVGISGMILPGISGSFILLLLGLYNFIIDQIKELTQLNLQTESLLQLLVFILGLVIGFTVFVRLLKKGLEKVPNEIMAFLIGLMIGSLRVIYPFTSTADAKDTSVAKSFYMPWEFKDEYNLAVIYLLFALGIGVVVILSRISKVDRKQFKKLNS